ncbi:MAG TPA: hypothetical protein VHK24_00695 [Steroidobacter sp.]|nr:hypothetical protein [Steroidobacter sp.]
MTWSVAPLDASALGGLVGVARGRLQPMEGLGCQRVGFPAVDRLALYLLWRNPETPDRTNGRDLPCD